MGGPIQNSRYKLCLSGRRGWPFLSKFAQRVCDGQELSGGGRDGQFVGLCRPKKVAF